MKKSELMATNPLLQPFAEGGPDLFPAFAKIKPEHFRPALNFAMAETRRLAKRIATNTEPPTFENTVLAFEKATAMIDYVFNVFYVHTFAARSDEIERLEETHFPKLISLYADIYMQEDAYKRFKKLESQKDKLNLTQQQLYLLEVFSETFRYYGCHLSKAKKMRLKEIDEEITRLGTEFDYNLQEQHKSYGLAVDRLEDLQGIPDDFIQMAAEEASKRNMPGKWVVTAEDSVKAMLLSYADNRALRKRYYQETSTIGTAPDGNNYSVMKELLSLRYERAQIAGFKSHTDWVMTFQMAVNKKTTMAFLNELKRKATPKAKKDLAELRKFARTIGINKVEPWDFSFCAEKLRKEKYNFNSQSLRPYFSLEKVLNGAFQHCEKLYGVTFAYNPDYPKIDKDVFTFDVFDEKTKEHAGVLIVDPYLRDNKAGHYYSIETLSHGKYAGKKSIATVILHLNFARPTKDTPSLLSEHEVKTVFHEMGHAMHSILGKADYKILSGLTCVTSDFSELPSQLNENWALEPEVLDTYARHYQTGEAVPKTMIAQLKESQRFMGGHRLLRGLRDAYMDLALHGRNPKYINLEKFEPKFLQENFPLISYKNLAPTVPTFSHIASTGMDSSYYSYLWSEALDADSFKMFKKKGLYDPELCEKLQAMMKAAGTKLASDLYREFSGHDINSAAMLERYGIGRHKPAFNFAALPQQAANDEPYREPESQTTIRRKGNKGPVPS